MSKVMVDVMVSTMASCVVKMEVDEEMPDEEIKDLALELAAARDAREWSLNDDWHREDAEILDFYDTNEQEAA